MNQDCDAPNHSESASAVEPQVDTLYEMQEWAAVRLKSFSPATLPAWADQSAYELDEAGIPQIAYWNTKGDTPVYAVAQPGIYSYLVVYVDDQVIDLVKHYLEATTGVSNPQ